MTTHKELNDSITDLAYQFNLLKFIHLYNKEISDEQKNILNHLFTVFVTTEFKNNVQNYKQDISDALAELFLQESIDIIVDLLKLNKNKEMFSLLQNLLFERVWHKSFTVDYSDLVDIQTNFNNKSLFARAILLNSKSDSNHHMLDYFQSYLNQHKKMFVSSYNPEDGTGTTQLQLMEHPSTLEYLNKPFMISNYEKLYNICVEKGYENHHIIMVSLGFTNYNEFFETKLFFEDRQKYSELLKIYFETIPSFQLKINFHTVPKHPSLQPVLSESSYLLTTYNELEEFLNRIPERN